jgi:hypothetical protein
VEDSQDAREEVLLPAYRVTGKPEVNFSIADDSGAIDKHCAVYVPPQLEMERAFRR